MIGWPHTSFSRICPSFCPQRGGSHVTITHDPVDFTVKRPSLLPSPDVGPHWTGVPFHLSPGYSPSLSPTSDSQLAQIGPHCTGTPCSDTTQCYPLPSADIWWLLKHITVSYMRVKVTKHLECSETNTSITIP